jgi:hypothetical protein
MILAPSDDCLYLLVIGVNYEEVVSSVVKVYLLRLINGIAEKLLNSDRGD